MPSLQNPSFVGRYAVNQDMIPNVYNGMRVEVLDRDNELLFFGDVEVLNEHMLEVVRASELHSQTVTENMPVSVRGFNAYENCGVYLDGMLSKLAHDQDSAGEGRSFARQPIHARAWVRSADEPSSGWLPCSVVDASAGGVCFRMNEPLEIGGRTRIRFRLRPGREQPPLTIEIRRATDRSTEYEYGCEFVDLSDEVGTIITRTVIQLQITQ